MPLRKSVSFSSQPPTPSTPPGKVVDEEALFLNPSDLTCPITCSVFNDPVLTASGHVSAERAASLGAAGRLQACNCHPAT